MLFKRLYVRIWLAVLLALAALTVVVGWAWQQTSDPLPREVVIRNDAGQIIGNGQASRRRAPGASTQAKNGDGFDAQMLSFGLGNATDRGHEYAVLMTDGQIVRLQLPQRKVPELWRWSSTPVGFFWLLALLGAVTALVTYPIIRKLTRHLALLQEGVEKWGQGDLSVRVSEGGSDEVAFLARRFNHAAERVESLLQAQRAMLANASHELRSPLARIRMGLELMGEAPSPEWQAEISRDVAELDQLVEEVLLASRLDAQEANLGAIEAVDLVALVAEECARVGADLDASQLGASELPVPGVARLVQRAIRNLLENARRHAPGEISVTLERHDAHARIAVCDRGPGVPAAQRERIFEPFYRLPGASERDGGIGLGLALVKSIAMRHGGTVQCQDRAGGGSCFILTLPLAP